MSTQVDEIRRQVDALDDKVHDLLMKRAELVIRIGKAKRADKIQFIQPDREALMIRRLLKRHEGLLPKEAIVRIWRELVGAVSLLQTGLKVVVCVNHEDPLTHWDMAKDYFSSVLPMKKSTDPLAALAVVRDGQASFAVVPWPEDDDTKPWWPYMIDQEGENPIRVMARLPFGDRVQSSSGPASRAIVIARVSFQPSGDDRSFLVMELDMSVSRTRIIDTLKKLDLETLSLFTQVDPTAKCSRHLVEVGDYVGNDHKILKEIMEKFDGIGNTCICIGGYPVPPIYEDSVGKGAEESMKEFKASI